MFDVFGLGDVSLSRWTTRSKQSWTTLVAASCGTFVLWEAATPVMPWTYRYIACLPIATLRGQNMAVDACFAANAWAELARLRHLFDGTQRAIDGRADVVCVINQVRSVL